MADNDALLKAIESLRKDMHSGFKQVNEKIETVDLKVEAFNSKLDATKQEILEKLAQDFNDIVGFFHETWKKMDETNERVTDVEEDLASVKSKN